MKDHSSVFLSIHSNTGIICFYDKSPLGGYAVLIRCGSRWNIRRAR